MLSGEVLKQGQHVMTVCNSCRYCEQFCPVFPAMERRLRFTKTDLSYLANLCHNCSECLYACQYAPPHEFGINVPKTLAQVRLAAYDEYCWPRSLAGMFRRQGVLTGLLLAAVLSSVMFAGTWLLNPGGFQRGVAAGEFYAVVPHLVMVSVFGGVSLFVLAALVIAVRRFWRDLTVDLPTSPSSRAILTALRQALSLAHLKSSGADCTDNEEVRTPWRRRFHHYTFYGFLLCFASTSVAAIYHTAFQWSAPYAFTSIPVLLGTIGGLGLLIGPAGLFVLRRQRDPATNDPGQRGLDESFISLLLLTSLTGLLLLMLRDSTAMPALLIVHLGVVMALFITMPYGKFVHGFYRVAALVKHAIETEHEAGSPV
jgi:citrate/tricarballylate utilization protein